MGWVGAGSRSRRVVRRAGVASSLIDSRSGATFPAAGLAEGRRRAGVRAAEGTAAGDGAGGRGPGTVLRPGRGRCLAAEGASELAAYGGGVGGQQKGRGVEPRP